MAHVLEVMAVVASQAAALTASVDVGALVVKIGLGLLVGTCALFLKRLLGSFDALSKNVDTKFAQISENVAGVERGVQTLTQEMFGVSGQNGMRGTLKSIERTVIRHDRALIRLSAKAGLPAVQEESA